MEADSETVEDSDTNVLEMVIRPENDPSVEVSNKQYSVISEASTDSGISSFPREIQENPFPLNFGGNISESTDVTNVTTPLPDCKKIAIVTDGFPQTLMTLEQFNLINRKMVYELELKSGNNFSASFKHQVFFATVTNELMRERLLKFVCTLVVDGGRFVAVDGNHTLIYMRNIFYRKKCSQYMIKYKDFYKIAVVSNEFPTADVMMDKVRLLKQHANAMKSLELIFFTEPRPLSVLFYCKNIHTRNWIKEYVANNPDLCNLRTIEHEIFVTQKISYNPAVAAQYAQSNNEHQQPPLVTSKFTREQNGPYKPTERLNMCIYHEDFPYTNLEPELYKLIRREIEKISGYKIPLYSRNFANMNLAMGIMYITCRDKFSIKALNNLVEKINSWGNFPRLVLSPTKYVRSIAKNYRRKKWKEYFNK